ncbi:MAG: CHASE2 domain-containing protein [Gammaproteobacteria bacterium]|nr:CHASE2 domain-containing protein [Gammaproteobacteria bacterium]
MKWIKTKTSVGTIEHFLLIIILSLTAALFAQNKVLWRWDHLLYDAQLSLWSRTVADDIIIIAIDDESLNTLGRWPWPRSIHAQLIEQLTRESARAIGLDIVFSEPDLDNPESDQLLARAMQNSGKVVLPVFMSQQNLHSYPLEALPLPLFSNSAAALGHVHIDISEDGIARRIYLQEGIGKPHWNHYSLALMSVSGETIAIEKRLQTGGQNKQYSPMQWSRQFPYLIPYAGPAGHFQQIGYSQVLAGQYSKDLFRDKIVLIGTTAEGIGDALPTPLSGDGGIMPGVEIVANVIDSIRNDLSIHPLDNHWLVMITALMVALPLLIYPVLNPGSTLLALFGIAGASLVVVALLLWLFGIWLPISTLLLFQFISYPLWSWRRLEIAMRHINTELNQLARRHQALSLRRERKIEDDIRFISQFIPLSGWVLQNLNGDNLLAHGKVPEYRQNHLEPGVWNADGGTHWALTRYQNKPCRLGLSADLERDMTAAEMRLLDGLIDAPLVLDQGQSAYVEDLLQTKIKILQAAGREYEELRAIIDDSLAAMADGVLICSSRGQVMLSNRRAGWYLYADDDAKINGQMLNHVLQHLHLQDRTGWNELLQAVLFERKRVLTHVRHESGRELMVEFSPLRIIGDRFDGIVVNLSDVSLLKASEKKRNEVLDFLSHDLRSPLSSMLAMIEISRTKSSLDEMLEMLGVMEKNTYKVLHLAEQFLNLSRANTSAPVKFYDIDFNTVVLNALDQLWALSHKMNVTIKHQFEQEECWTHAEADLLERAIVNLLSNAIKYSEAGSTVHVSVSQSEQEIHCCVIDQGCGISAAEMPHLFEMFRRSQGAGVERIQGVGLGLAFVDAVARRHSGTVEVESQPGAGSKFCLKIPRIDPAGEFE